MQEKDNKYIDLYDENNQMHEDMLELQEQLEEAGFIGDGFSDEGLDEDGGSGGKSGSLHIPGKKNAKKVMKTLGKLLKKKKNKEKKSKKEKEDPIPIPIPEEELPVEKV